MTRKELQREWEHIVTNRLGSLCGPDKPTQAQLEIAEFEADAWLARQKPDPEPHDK